MLGSGKILNLFSQKKVEHTNQTLYNKSTPYSLKKDGARRPREGDRFSAPACASIFWKEPDLLGIPADQPDLPTDSRKRGQGPSYQVLTSLLFWFYPPGVMLRNPGNSPR